MFGCALRETLALRLGLSKSAQRIGEHGSNGRLPQKSSEFVEATKRWVWISRHKGTCACHCNDINSIDHNCEQIYWTNRSSAVFLWGSLSARRRADKVTWLNGVYHCVSERKLATIQSRKLSSYSVAPNLRRFACECIQHTGGTSLVRISIEPAKLNISTPVELMSSSAGRSEQR